MKRTTLLLALAVAGILGTLTAPAQNIQLKNGKIVAAKALRREGDTIMATVEMPSIDPTKPAPTGDIGYPLAQISRLDFPEPPPLKTAPDLIAQGRGAEALQQLDASIKYYEPFRDAPGSWWPDVASLQMQALNSMGRQRDTETLAQKIVSTATDPDLVLEAKVQLAAGILASGQQEKALAICEEALKSSHDPGTCALAALIKGQCLLNAQEWDDALLSFLQVPVLYPEEKALLPPAMLGAGRAHFGMDNLDDARAIMQDVISNFAASNEAALAKEELKKIARREIALAPPK